MLATDEFVFIHTHKTGGQFVAAVLRDLFPDLVELGYHYPRSMIPKEHAHKPVVGFVRSPWDWYVSWYAFNNSRKGMNPMFTILSEDWSLDFNSTVSRLVRLSEDTDEAGALRRAVKGVLPVSIEGNRTSGLTQGSIDEMVDGERGYVTWLYQRMLDFERDENLHVGKQENLREDLLAILERCGVVLSPEGVGRIRDAQPLNVSEHESYRRYFSEELRELVLERDRAVIGRFGYEF